jgi:hypothetical protein
MEEGVRGDILVTRHHHGDLIRGDYAGESAFSGEQQPETLFGAFCEGSGRERRGVREWGVGRGERGVRGCPFIAERRRMVSVVHVIMGARV